MIKVYRPITIYFSYQSRGGAANLIRDRHQDQDNKTHFTEPTPFKF